MKNNNCFPTHEEMLRSDFDCKLMDLKVDYLDNRISLFKQYEDILSRKEKREYKKLVSERKKITPIGRPGKQIQRTKH